MAENIDSEGVRPLDRIDRLIHEPARLSIMAYLYVVDSADFIFLVHHTGMSWGNLSAHMSKLETACYIEVVKDFVDKRPHTMLRLTEKGREAFREYRRKMKDTLDELPD